MGDMIGSWHSYPSIFNMGDRAIAELLHDDVLVEEKIDGSQFSFGLFEEPHVDMQGLPTPYAFGESPVVRLRIRSKGAEMILEAPEKMFQAAVGTVLALQKDLHLGWTYRSEFLAKPKHNVLAYDRIPAGHLMIFDINDAHESYLSYDAKAAEAERLGLEVVPRLYEGHVGDLATFRQYLETPSSLGGQKVEGVVVKQRQVARYGADKKALMGKFVSEAFKETHAKTWKAENPNSGDIIERLIVAYHSQARWLKGIQHLREAGALEDSPHDIGALFREIPEDVKRECESEIKDKLFQWAWPRIQRGVMAGFPEFYKDLLLKKQFETTP